MDNEHIASIRAALQSAVDNSPDLIIDLSLKARDPNEPERRAKANMERQLAILIYRRFRSQARLLRQRLEMIYPSRKVIWDEMIYPETIGYHDPIFNSRVLRVIVEGVRAGVSLFSQQVNIGLDYTMVNTRAAEWASRYAGELITKIDEVTRQSVAQAVNQFVTTPGMTIGDVVSNIPAFDEQRALTIATTETTRAYAEGQDAAGRELQTQYPGVRIIKKWYTNNDDRVCPICGPLGDGGWIDIDKPFDFGPKMEEIQKPPAHPRCRCWMSTSTDITGNKR
jgi:hypothetical protein